MENPLIDDANHHKSLASHDFSGINTEIRSHQMRCHRLVKLATNGAEIPRSSELGNDDLEPAEVMVQDAAA